MTAKAKRPSKKSAHCESKKIGTAPKVTLKKPTKKKIKTLPKGKAAMKKAF